MTLPATTTIRPERAADLAGIREVVLAAFAHHPEVAELVELIRASPEYVPELALVAEVSSDVVGFVMLSHAGLVGDAGERHRILTLSPLAVAPEWQGRGIGSALVRAGLVAAAARPDEPLVVLEGSPRYYPRFGFADCRELGIAIELPDWAPPEAGMAYRLPGYSPRLRGRVVYPPAFAVVGAGHS